jgi:circadian clock protein KaiB
MNHEDEVTAGDVETAEEVYVLQLFVTGATARSVNAIKRIKDVCENELHGRYTLQIIDIYQQPELLRDSQVVATPTLVKHLPSPVRRLIGDLADREKVLAGLELKRRS